MKSISPKSHVDRKNDVVGVQKGTKRSTGPNVNLLGPNAYRSVPYHHYSPFGLFGPLSFGDGYFIDSIDFLDFLYFIDFIDFMDFMDFIDFLDFIDLLDSIDFISFY